MKSAAESFEETGHAPPVDRAEVTLWLAFLAGPWAVLVMELLVYMMVPHACRHETKWLMHVVAAGAVFGILIAMGRCSAEARRLGDAPPRAQDSPRPGTRRLLGTVGLWLGLLSLLGVIAQWLAIFLETPCKL